MSPPTITAAVEPLLDVVELTVTVPSPDDRLTVSRVGPSGVPAVVRGAGELEVAAGTLIVRDYEAPLGVELTYTATSWQDATPAELESDTDVVTVPSSPADDPWLVDLTQPGNTQRVLVEGLAELEYQAPAGVHEVLGRRSPIVTTDVARTPTLELVLVTAGELERERARAALGNGAPLLLRTPPEHGVGNLYLFTTGWSEQRLGRLALYGDRRLVVRAQQVERPDPQLFTPGAGFGTYAQVLAEFATYAALLAAVATYDELAYDYTALLPIDSVPWPPADV